MTKINLQEMFVVQMERLISGINEINAVTPMEIKGEKWWMSMIEVKTYAREIVQQFKTNQTQSNEDQHK